VKDRSYLGRPVPCPDCHSRLILTVIDGERLQATVIDGPPVAATNNASRPAFSAVTGAGPAWGGRVRIVSWGAAFLVAGLIAAVVFWPKQPTGPIVAQIDQDAATVAESDILPAPANDDAEGAMGEDMPLVSFESNQEDAKSQGSEPAQPAEADPELVKSPDPESPAEPAAMPEQPAPVVVVEPPPFDFDKALNQPLQQLRQSESISRNELLELLSELLGAPIRYEDDQLGALIAALEQKISLDLSDTTVGKVLDRVLEKTGIVYERERDGLRLRPAAEVNSESKEKAL
jgi:DNA-binding transcriptional ArsR family regulator